MAALVAAASAAAGADEGGGGRVPGGAASAQLAVGTAQDVAPSLVRLLLERLERRWHSEERSLGPRPDSEPQIAVADFVTRGYLRRRQPDEIEAVLATLDAGAMDLIRQSFEEQALGMQQFVEAIVRTGTYEPDRIVAFIGGIVDLFLETLRSQAERATVGQTPGTVNWAQVMNHFIECPEIAMFEGSEGGILGTKVASSMEKQPQVQRNNFVDRAKHQSCGIEKIYWAPYVDTLITVEGNESVNFFSPHAPGLDAPRAVLTPELGPDFRDENDRPLYHVQAVAFDEELQDLAVVLNNRMLIMWRLRNREKCQWQQKRELRFDSYRQETKGAQSPHWQVKLLTIDPQTGQDIHAVKKPDPETEGAMRKTLNESRLAEEAAVQLDIWWNTVLKCWITTDAKGQLSLWDLRVMEGAWLEAFVSPKKVLREHTRLVTSHLELNRNKFTTCSLDRSVILWDHKNLVPEMKLSGGGGHSASVLSQAYLPRFNSLVTVACEKKVFVWTIDSTAYRGMKGKLSGHQGNVMRVSAGQRVFFTLDEAFIGILWDGATLASLQTISCATIVPRHCTCLPEHGTICLSGRRLNFVEGNEVAAEKLGKPLTKEQQANALNKLKEGASLKESAAPKFCGLADSRACILSATEVEVRLHSRANPGSSRALFNAAEGEIISAFAASDGRSLSVFGTSKGAIHFIKYRSGFSMKMYPGKREGDDWQGSSGGGEAGGGEAGEKDKKTGRSRAGTMASGADASGRSPSPTAGGGGNRSPMSAAGKGGGATSPLNAANFSSQLGAGEGGGASGEDDGGRDGGAGDAARRTARGDVAMRNAPTAEEIQRGMSSNITSILLCEEEDRVFVGTAEGQVLIFTCDPGFPVLRWISHPDDPSAVTCLNCGAMKEAGLLVVGTQDGSVHLYKMPNFRLAGSINIARLMFEGDAASQGAALRHVKLFAVRAGYDCSLTVMTVDMASRVRLWGLEIHEQSGKLKELKLVMDGGQLREIDSIPVASRPKPRAKKAAKSKKEAKPEMEREKYATCGASPSAMASGESEGAVKAVLQRSFSQDFVQLSAITVMDGPVTLPTRALAKQHRDGPFRADDKEDIAPNKAAEIGAEADPKRKEREREEAAATAQSLFLTSIGSAGTARSTPKSTVNGVNFPDIDEETEEAEAPPEFSGSDTDGEADETVGRRFHRRPTTPKPPPLAPPGVNEAEHAAAFAPVVGEGSQHVFLADTGGWIWCVDVKNTVATAIQRSAAVNVVLDPVAARATTAAGVSSRRTHGHSRASLKLPPGQGHLMMDRRANLDDHGPVLARPLQTIKATPEAFKVVGAWPAHLTAVLSLVPVSSPSALVSTDATKEVKVWSTAGDLWGHFSLRGVEGAQPPVAMWPPPHVLSAQVALMRTAKQVCRRMCFHANKADECKAVEERRQHQAKKTQSQRHPRRLEKEASSSSAAAPGAGGGGSGSRDRNTSGSSGTVPSDPRERVSTSFTQSSTSVEGAEEAATLAAALISGEAQASGAAGGAKEGGAAAAAAAAGSGAAATATSAAAGEPGAEAAAPPEEPAAAAGEGQADEEAGQDDGGGMGGSGPPSRRRRRNFTQGQLSEMVRNHAFSSGFQSYKSFIRKVEPSRSESSFRLRGDRIAELEAQRKTFFGREAQAFGVELTTAREAEKWEATVRSLGPRSASEGALLRYAHSAVEDMTRSVNDHLGVDVSRVTRKQIKRASFVQRMDIGGVSASPGDPMSATGQAVRKLCATTVTLPPVDKPGGQPGSRRRTSKA